MLFFPQIAIAIGVLTSNKGGGRRTTLADWTGAVDVVPLLGAIVVFYCGGGEGDDQLWGSGRGAIAGVPLQGAIVVCYGRGGFFLYIDSTKIGFCYLGSMLV